MRYRSGRNSRHEDPPAFSHRSSVDCRHFRGHHDGGFMLGCSYGNALRLDPSDESRAVLRDGAAALGSRFVPELGMIRSWDFKPYTCPVIIDNMMNLELLTLSSPEFLAESGSHGGFILTRSTGHLPANSEVNVPLVYADYYFLEALLRYQALATGKNRVSFGAARCAVEMPGPRKNPLLPCHGSARD